MRVPVHSVQDVGMAVRVVRKSSGVRQDDAAGSAGVSHVFLRDLEHGKQTVQFGRVLQVLNELGIRHCQLASLKWNVCSNFES